MWRPRSGEIFRSGILPRGFACNAETSMKHGPARAPRDGSELFSDGQGELVKSLLNALSSEARADRHFQVADPAASKADSREGSRPYPPWVLLRQVLPSSLRRWVSLRLPTPQSTRELLISTGRDHYDELKAVWEDRFEKTHGSWRGFTDTVVARYLDSSPTTANCSVSSPVAPTRRSKSA